MRTLAKTLFCTAASLMLAAPLSAVAQDKPDALKVCQDPNNMPYSNEAGEGIENKVAELFAKKMGVPLKYFSFPQRLAFVRNTIRYKLPGEDYRCDVMLNVPKRFGQVSRTNTWYRSTYALVYPEGGKLDGVKSGEDFLARAREAIGIKRLGIHDLSPASAWLSKHNLTPLARPYLMMSPDPKYYPGQIIEKELAQGNLDAVIVWGPIAGYYASQVKDKKMVVVPLQSEPGVKFDYEMAMGVRYGEPAWRKKIQNLIDSSGPELIKILSDFGVPLVDELGEPISSAKIQALTGAASAGGEESKKPAKAEPSAQDEAARKDKQAREEKLAQEKQAQVDAAAAKAAAAQKAAAQAAAAEKLAAQKAAQEKAAEQKAAAEQAAAEKAAEKAAAEKAAAEKAAADQKANQAASNEAPKKPTTSAAAALYSVKDGYFVDAATYEGFKTWRAAACDRCHGANQQGLVGPSLIESLKVLTKDEFVTVVRDGRLDKGMQSFGNHKKVMANMDALYAYLKGRSEGAITRAKVKKIPNE